MKKGANRERGIRWAVSLAKGGAAKPGPLGGDELPQVGRKNGLHTAPGNGWRAG